MSLCQSPGLMVAYIKFLPVLIDQCLVSVISVEQKFVKKPESGSGAVSFRLLYVTECNCNYFIKMSINKQKAAFS